MTIHPAAPRVALIFALLGPSNAFACLHGGSMLSVQTGALAGNDRTERLVASHTGSSPRIVKLFIGPPSATVTARELTPDEMKLHAELEKVANSRLSSANRSLFSMPSKAASISKTVDEFATVNGTRVRIEAIQDGVDWTAIRTHFDLPSSDADAAYQAWVNRISKNGRALYAAVIDVSKQVKADPNEIFSLAATISYTGSADDIQHQVALDKWLEYLSGSNGDAAILRTNWNQSDLGNAMTAAVNSLQDVAESGLKAELIESGSNAIVVIAGRRLFRIDGGDVSYRYDGTVRLVPSSAAAPRHARSPVVPIPDTATAKKELGN